MSERSQAHVTARVSILIVSYHAYDALERCLTSLARFEPDAEVILVDHDADPVRGRALSGIHPSVQYIPKTENPGFGAGTNFAAERASAPYLLLLNPDVELTEPVTDGLIACLASHPDVAVVGGRIREEDGKIQPSARRFPDVSTAFGGRTSLLTRLLPGNPLTKRNLGSDRSRQSEAVVDWVTGAYMMIRADVFRAVRGFDERFFMYWEDADLCRRLRSAGWKTMYQPRFEVVHLTGRSSLYAPLRSAVAFHASASRYYWKHGSLMSRALWPLAAAGLGARLLLVLTRRRWDAAWHICVRPSK